jgi:hypothetical protein
VKKYSLLSLTILLIVFISYFIYGFEKFASGVNENTKRRNDFFKKKGTRLDSMGIVEYEDYIKLNDTIKNKRYTNQ